MLNLKNSKLHVTPLYMVPPFQVILFFANLIQTMNYHGKDCVDFGHFKILFNFLFFGGVIEQFLV